MFGKKKSFLQWGKAGRTGGHHKRGTRRKKKLELALEGQSRKERLRSWGPKEKVPFRKE